MTVVALVAGGALPLALVLGASMTLLQFAIGTLNDLVDVPGDRASRRGKPIADGLVGEQAARVLIALFVGAGLLLAWAGGPLLLIIALGVLGIGVWYDLVAKGTRLSWLPLAIGVPLLPVYGWLGAKGTLPPAFAILVPVAALAGAALAIANAAVDIERDRAAGVSSAAVALGPVGATALALLLQLVVAAVAVVSGIRIGATGIWMSVAGSVALVPVAGAAFGVLVARRGPAAREIAFEVQAVGLGLLTVAWVNAVSAVALG